jgi:hypothetical protein
MEYETIHRENFVSPGGVIVEKIQVQNGKGVEVESKTGSIRENIHLLHRQRRF